MTASRKKRLLWAAGGAVILLAATVLFLRYRSGRAGGGFDSSGQPGPAGANPNQSGAQEPGGGASSVPGNLPDSLLTAPDQLQQQVQQTDAGSTESPQSISQAQAPVQGTSEVAGGSIGAPPDKGRAAEAQAQVVSNAGANVSAGVGSAAGWLAQRTQAPVITYQSHNIRALEE